jgi:hypothetical protein
VPDPTATSCPSLYELTAVKIDRDPGNPAPPPGTVYTASIETIDNDRAGLLMQVGVVR